MTDAFGTSVMAAVTLQGYACLVSSALCCSPQHPLLVLFLASTSRIMLPPDSSGPPYMTDGHEDIANPQDDSRALYITGKKKYLPFAEKTVHIKQVAQAALGV
ncbi:hypothetical protein C8R45DRAFT_1114290 [Mycena sanguinolenta]|nr:hypothetical protein C8R45DRAFT_1114290 [Mycena sanguinolenta]